VWTHFDLWREDWSIKAPEMEPFLFFNVGNLQIGGINVVESMR
jgi:hypothetical protein